MNITVNFNRTEWPNQFTTPTIPSERDNYRKVMGLVDADLDKAYRFMCPEARLVAERATKSTRKYVSVDVKVHMLMKGMCPAIPGWHTDGAYRGDNKDPRNHEVPNFGAMEREESSIFHLFVGGNTQPEFLTVRNVPIEIKKGAEYAFMTRQVNGLIEQGAHVWSPGNTIVTFDWWDIHRATVAQAYEWRLLVRVNERNYGTPLTDPSEFIRNQQNVYLPMEYGW